MGKTVSITNEKLQIYKNSCNYAIKLNFEKSQFDNFIEIIQANRSWKKSKCN